MTGAPQRTPINGQKRRGCACHLDRHQYKGSQASTATDCDKGLRSIVRFLPAPAGPRSCAAGADRESRLVLALLELKALCFDIMRPHQQYTAVGTTVPDAYRESYVDGPGSRELAAATFSGPFTFSKTN